MKELRTDRLGLLLDQLDFAREIAQARLEGMVSPASLPHGAPIGPRQGGGRPTDEEYLWEPVPGAWSIRRRGEAVSPKPFGRGEWVLDEAAGDPYPAPITTIAWQLGTSTATSPANGSGPSASGGRPPSWSTSRRPPTWRWSGSGRRWTAGARASRP